MTNQLCQHLVLHGHGRLAPHRIARLALDGAEHGLDQAPLVIVSQKLLASVLVVVEHLLEKTACRAGRVDLRCNERDAARAEDGFDVFDRQVALVGAHLFHGERLFGCVEQFGQDRAIGRVLVIDRCRRDHLRFDAACQVDLHPIVLSPLDAVLAIKPAYEPGGRKPGGIDGELRLDGTEWQRATDDHGPEVRCQFLVGHEAVDLVGMQWPRQVPAPVRLFQVAVETPARQRGPNFQVYREEAVGERDARLSGVLVECRINGAAAQVRQQNLDSVLLLLGARVYRPVLLVGRTPGHGIDHDGWRVAVVVALADQARRQDVLARLPMECPIVTLTGRQLADGDAVLFAALGLAWHNPSILVPSDPRPRGKFKGFQLAEVHGRHLLGNSVCIRMPKGSLVLTRQGAWPLGLLEQPQGYLIFDILSVHRYTTQVNVSSRFTSIFRHLFRRKSVPPTARRTHRIASGGRWREPPPIYHQEKSRGLREFLGTMRIPQRSVRGSNPRKTTDCPEKLPVVLTAGSQPGALPLGQRSKWSRGDLHPSLRGHITACCCYTTTPLLPARRLCLRSRGRRVRVTSLSRSSFLPHCRLYWGANRADKLFEKKIGRLRAVDIGSGTQSLDAICGVLGGSFEQQTKAHRAATTQAPRSSLRAIADNRS